MTIDRTFDSPDDMPPEMRNYCEFLRQRARAQGCCCRPEIVLNTLRHTTFISHHPRCPVVDAAQN